MWRGYGHELAQTRPCKIVDVVISILLSSITIWNCFYRIWKASTGISLHSTGARRSRWSITFRRAPLICFSGSASSLTSHVAGQNPTQFNCRSGPRLPTIPPGWNCPMKPVLIRNSIRSSRTPRPITGTPSGGRAANADRSKMSMMIARSVVGDASADQPLRLHRCTP